MLGHYIHPNICIWYLWIGSVYTVFFLALRCENYYRIGPRTRQSLCRGYNKPSTVVNQLKNEQLGKKLLLQNNLFTKLIDIWKCSIVNLPCFNISLIRNLSLNCFFLHIEDWMPRFLFEECDLCRLNPFGFALKKILESNPAKHDCKMFMQKNCFWNPALVDCGLWVERLLHKRHDSAPLDQFPLGACYLLCKNS